MSENSEVPLDFGKIQPAVEEVKKKANEKPPTPNSKKAMMEILRDRHLKAPDGTPRKMQPNGIVVELVEQILKEDEKEKYRAYIARIRQEESAKKHVPRKEINRIVFWNKCYWLVNKEEMMKKVEKNAAKKQRRRDRIAVAKAQREKKRLEKQENLVKSEDPGNPEGSNKIEETPIEESKVSEKPKVAETAKTPASKGPKKQPPQQQKQPKKNPNPPKSKPQSLMEKKFPPVRDFTVPRPPQFFNNIQQGFSNNSGGYQYSVDNWTNNGSSNNSWNPPAPSGYAAFLASSSAPTPSPFTTFPTSSVDPYSAFPMSSSTSSVDPYTTFPTSSSPYSTFPSSSSLLPVNDAYTTFPQPSFSQSLPQTTSFPPQPLSIPTSIVSDLMVTALTGSTPFYPELPTQISQPSAYQSVFGSALAPHQDTSEEELKRQRRLAEIEEQLNQINARKDQIAMEAEIRAREQELARKQHWMDRRERDMRDRECFEIGRRVSEWDMNGQYSAPQYYDHHHKDQRYSMEGHHHEIRIDERDRHRADRDEDAWRRHGQRSDERKRLLPRRDEEGGGEGSSWRLDDDNDLRSRSNQKAKRRRQ